MKHWAYRATPTKVSFEDVAALAALGFVCRSAYTEAEKPLLVTYLKHIEIGDVLHMHYSYGREIEAIGPYVICERAGHLLRDHVEDGIVEKTGGLYAVRDTSFLDPHNRDGEYVPDPVLKRITGWLVRPARCALVQYDRDHFSPYGLTMGKIPEELWPVVAS